MNHDALQREIDLRDEAIRRIDAELARNMSTERLMFTLTCPVCGARVTAYNERTTWRILVHRVNGERCAGSGWRLKMRTAKGRHS